ncbi:unnamed protein product [Ophioblennius macclurei]
MYVQWILLVVVFGGVFSNQNKNIQSVLEVTARPGDNITVYCDCKPSRTLHIVWYRHCTHENQPPLVLKARRSEFETNILKTFPHFRLVKNQTSESYDLLIINITRSYEGLYYCGTEEIKVEEKDRVSLKYDYVSGNVTTRIIFNSSEPQDDGTSSCGLCWMLLVLLCPLVAGVSSLLTCQPCRRKGKDCDGDEEGCYTRGQIQCIQDEDMWLLSRDIQQTLKKNKGWSSDLTFCTYSPVVVTGTGKNRQVKMTVS